MKDIYHTMMVHVVIRSSPYHSQLFQEGDETMFKVMCHMRRCKGQHEPTPH